MLPPGRDPSHRLLLIIGLVPAPGVYSGAPLKDPLAVDIRHHIGITGKQGLGCAHTGTEWDLAFGDAILAIQMFFLSGKGLFRPTCTEGALVHGTAGAKHLAFGELGRPKRTGHETIPATDAGLFVHENDTVIPLINGIHRTDGKAWSIGAVHAGNGDGFLAGFPLIQGDHPAAVYTNRDMIAFLTGDYATAAIDTALRIA